MLKLRIETDFVVIEISSVWFHYKKIESAEEIYIDMENEHNPVVIGDVSLMKECRAWIQQALTDCTGSLSTFEAVLDTTYRLVN